MCDAGEPLAGRRILLVEDEALIALHTASIIEDTGAEVIGPAASVTSALRLIDMGAPDAAVLDVQLDGETSRAIAEALSALRRPFVVVTAYAARDLDEPLRSAPLLGKPINDADLARVLVSLFAACR